MSKLNRREFIPAVLGVAAGAGTAGTAKALDKEVNDGPIWEEVSQLSKCVIKDGKLLPVFNCPINADIHAYVDLPFLLSRAKYSLETHKIKVQFTDGKLHFIQEEINPQYMRHVGKIDVWLEPDNARRFTIDNVGYNSRLSNLCNFWGQCEIILYECTISINHLYFSLVPTERSEIALLAADTPIYKAATERLRTLNAKKV